MVLTSALVENLKEWSVVPKTSLYDINLKILIKKKRLLPKFQLIPILRLQVMHDYVHWHCSIHVYY